MSPPPDDNHLRPLERRMLEAARALEADNLKNWTLGDLKGLGSYGSIRNAISRLRRLKYVETLYWGHYHLTARGREGGDKLPHEGAVALRALLEEVGAFEDPAVHNIRLAVRGAGYYERERGRLPWRFIPENDGLLAEWVLPSGRRGKVLIFPSDVIQVIISSSWDPYPASVEGLMVIASDLGSVHRCLSEPGHELPNVSEWVAENWEWGRDSKGSVSGPSL